MRKGMLCLLAALVLSAAMSGEARATTYRYTDDRGVIHLIDNLSSIPQKYHSSVREIEEDKRAEGYTPSVGQAIGAEQFSSDAWFKYSEMPFYERWFLLARAGLMDIKPILKVMAPWIGLAGLVLALAYFFIFKLFEAPAKKGAVALIVVALVTGGLFCKYISIVEGHSDTLLRMVRQLRGADAERQGNAPGIPADAPMEKR